MRRAIYSFFLVCLFSCGESDQSNAPRVDNYVISEKSVFRNILTKEGYLDTIYRTRYQYHEGELVDSSVTLIVCTNNQEGKVSSKKYYELDKDSKPRLIGNWSFSYDKQGHILESYKSNSGLLEEKVRYQYDDTGRLLTYSGVKLKSSDHADLDDHENDFQQVAAQSADYNTTNVAYEYDQLNKVVRSVATDAAGNLIRTSVNLYTGNMPLASYSVNPKGDTIQKIDYKMEENKLLRMTVQNDTVIVTKWVGGNWTFAQLTENKRNKKKWKKIFKYDTYGRKIEQVLYAAE